MFVKKLSKPLLILLFVIVALLIKTEFALIQAQNWVYLPIIIKPAYEPQKGIVLAHEEYCSDLETLNIKWYYNNQISPSSSCPTVDRRFVPRLYGGEQVNDTNILNAAIQNAFPSGWLIGFVEPNLAWHANMTPLEGAIAWRKVEQAAAPYNIKLVAPAPSQHNPYANIRDDYSPEPYGYTWIWAMIDAYHSQCWEGVYCNEYPKIDAFAWNYYENEPSKFDSFFRSRRTEADTKYGGHYANTPFWILEYAGECWNSVNGSPTGNADIMNQVTPAFKNKIYNVTRYAWFTHRIRPDEAWGINHHSCSLLDPDTGNILTLGNLYRQY